ncbi:MAG: hypothetical protein PVG66_09785 [Chromatiales bacterium]|jgi:ferric-dicitrate binding protein FerR (iron transport regulator)
MNEQHPDKSLEELLPWYVNNTLSDSEREQVEQFLQRSPEAQQEVERLKTLQQRVRQNQETFEGTELGWRRLQRDIRKQAQPSGQRFWSTRMKQFAAVAATIVIGVQTALLYDQQNKLEQATRLLSGSSGSQSATAANQLVFRLKFRPDSQWQKVNELVDAIGGRIIDGPGALGLLTVSVAAEPDQAEQQRRLLDQLQQHPLVEHVQPGH